MNGGDNNNQDSYRAFLLLSEIEGDEPLSQREISHRLGVALGLVNSYMKNFVTKGFVRVKAFPRNRYAYLLTPKGLAEKSRLAYQHVNYFNNLYKVARQDYRHLFSRLETAGVKQVSFCGVDEAAEIAYLSLRETTLTLAAVADDEAAGSKFFDHTVAALSDGLDISGTSVVITSLRREIALQQTLLGLGVPPERIFTAKGMVAAVDLRGEA